MKKLLAALALLGSLGFAQAQDALVVTTCGTLPLAYSAGATRQLTVDVNGKLCGSGGTAGGITIGTSVITGGTNTRVLFDDSGVVGESSGLTYVKSTGRLTSTNLKVGSALTANIALGVTAPTTDTLNQLFVGGNGVAMGQNVAAGEFEMGLNYYYNSGFLYRFASAFAARVAFNADADGAIKFDTAPATGTVGSAVTFTTRLRITTLGSVIVGPLATISTGATDGFLYIPAVAGTPTGVPTAMTAHVALIYDSTNKQFWIYDGGWLQPKTPAAAAIITWQ